MNNIELRDYFAGQAIVGVLAMPWSPDMGIDWRISSHEVALLSYEIADQMLAERAKHGGELVALDIPNTEAVQE